MSRAPESQQQARARTQVRRAIRADSETRAASAFDRLLADTPTSAARWLLEEWDGDTWRLAGLAVGVRERDGFLAAQTQP